MASSGGAVECSLDCAPIKHFPVANNRDFPSSLLKHTHSLPFRALHGKLCEGFFVAWNRNECACVMEAELDKQNRIFVGSCP
jgi:hypothetical protein